jgi:hypothetical protein
MRNSFFLSVVLLYCFFTHSMKNDTLPITSDQLPFVVGVSGAGLKGLNFFVGAEYAQSAGEYAISKYNSASNTLVPLAPEHVMLNGVAQENNPLFNAGFSYLSILERANIQRVAVVKNGTQEYQQVYLVDTFLRPDNISVLSSSVIKDASGINNAKKIIGLTHAQDSIIFVPVIGSESTTFGDANSGIAVLSIGEFQTPENKSVRILEQIDAGEGIPENPHIRRAALLDRSTAAIKINSNLSFIDDSIEMWWDSELRLLYGGLKVVGADKQEDGVRALFIGSFDTEGKNTLTIRPIVSTAAFFPESKNQIVGACGPNASINISKVCVMHTSTGLPYVIVVSNQLGTDRVYALPVVNKRNNKGIIATDDLELHGTLAKKDAQPVNVLSDQDVPRFLGRKFDDIVTCPSEMICAEDRFAQIGGQGVIPGNGKITAMKIVGDAVFISVGDGNAPGIFYSRALFDKSARINGWTLWQRVAGVIDPVVNFSLNTEVGNFVFLTKQQNIDYDTLKRTSWSSENKESPISLSSLVKNDMPQSSGGVRGLFSFSPDTPGLSGISLIMATGNNNVTLIETGSKMMARGTCVPHQHTSAIESVACINGTIDKKLHNALYISIKGGELQELGPITAAEIAYSSEKNNAWLCVGGTNGIAILCSSDGSGWKACCALSHHFKGLTPDMSFKKMGAYRFVRKLVCDNNFLYILSDNRCDRVDLQKSNFAQGDIYLDTIATSEDELSVHHNSIFLDLLVSEKLALVSTSKGFFRIGDSKNISTVKNFDDACWTPIAIPNNHAPVTKIIPISSTTRAQDISRNGGGNIYCLSGYRGKDYGQINRFTVSDTTDEDVGYHTVQPIPDVFKLVPFNHNKTSYFCSFGSVRDLVMSDGALFFNERNKEDSENLFIDNNTRHNKVTLPLNVDDGKAITGIVRDYASGRWFIGGDFGLKINE